MPLINLKTNLPDKDVPGDFELKLSEKVAEVLNKPMEKITVTMHTGLRQMRAGSSDPMVAVDIYSLNVFDKDRNPGYTKQFIPFFTDSLKLPEKRIYLLYHDIQLSDIGQIL